MAVDWAAVGAIAGVVAVIIAAWQLSKMYKPAVSAEGNKLQNLNSVPIQFSNVTNSVRRDLSYKISINSAVVSDKVAQAINGKYTTFKTMHCSIITLLNSNAESILALKLRFQVWDNVFAWNVVSATSLAKEAIQINTDSDPIQISIDHFPDGEEICIAIFCVGQGPSRELKTENGHVRLQRMR